MAKLPWRELRATHRIYFSAASGAGGPWIQTVLHSFTGGDDGFQPHGGLIVGEGGELFGTTRFGGALWSGTVFELTPPLTPGHTWTEKVPTSKCSATPQYVVHHPMATKGISTRNHRLFFGL